MSDSTFDELLTKLSPPPFVMRDRARGASRVVKSPAEHWWRTSSPETSPRGHRTYEVDVAEPAVDNRPSLGVFGYTRRPEYSSNYQVGHSPANFPRTVPSVGGFSLIPGYSGFIPGKAAGNCIGGTFARSNLDAECHLRTTLQAEKCGFKRE